jgi:translation elongation factor EF-G
MDERDIKINDKDKNKNYLNYNFNLHLLHDDVRRDLEMRDMYYEKYINSSEYYIKTKYVDQFFESKYENYISISTLIKYLLDNELSLYNVCKFYAIYFNYSNKNYYFRISPENINIFISDNWSDMKVFLMNFIDEYVDKINEKKEEKEKKMFEDIRKYILLKGISRKDFADMIKL